MQRSDEMYPTLIAHMERQSDFQNAMSRDMGEVKATLEHVLAEAKKTNGRVTSLETRLTALEQVRWKVVGYVGGVSMTISVIAVLIADWAKAKFLGS